MKWMFLRGADDLVGVPLGAIPGRSSRATRHYSGFRAQGRSYRGVRRRSGQRLIATGDTELLRIPTTMNAIERQKKSAAWGDAL